METVENMLAGAYAVRWLLVVVGFFVMGGWVALLVEQRNAAEKRARQLKDALKDEVEWSTQLDRELAEARASVRRSQIVALPGRSDAR